LVRQKGDNFFLRVTLGLIEYRTQAFLFSSEPSSSWIAFDRAADFTKLESLLPSHRIVLRLPQLLICVT